MCWTFYCGMLEMLAMRPQFHPRTAPFVLILTLMVAVFNCSADTPFKEYADKLRTLKAQNKMIDLCDWLRELHVADLTSLAPDDQLLFQEAFLFEAADAFDVEANRLKSSKQAANTYAE